MQVDDEGYVLDVFWANFQQAAMDRLELLKGFLTIEVERPATWNQEQVRQDSAAVNLRLTADKCALCRNVDLPRDWHHIITIRHGGSESPRNRIALCVRCHERLHPHLSGNRIDRSGWESVRDIASRLFRVDQ